MFCPLWCVDNLKDGFCNGCAELDNAGDCLLYNETISLLQVIERLGVGL